MQLLSSRTDYSRAERLSDAVIHVSGLAIAAVAVPVLIALTVLIRGDVPAILAIAIYGTALTAMLLFSALYNMIPHPEWSGLLRRLDHSAIYVKIAGTYTPFTLLSGHGGWLLTGIWAAAAGGVALKIAAPHRFRLAAVALYLAMGWAGVLAGGSFLATLSAPVIALMVAGGLLYTAGVAFYLWERLPFHYTIWHGFVLTATLTFYAAVTLHVVGTA